MKREIPASYEGEIFAEYYQRPKRNGADIVWTDKDNNIAEHRNTVDGVILYHPEIDRNGRPTGRCNKIKMPRSAVVAMYNRINEIEAEPVKDQLVD